MAADMQQPDTPQADQQPPAVQQLERITTDYVPQEDRLRLSASVANEGPCVVLWLTHRMLSQLLPHLWQWLQAQTPQPTQPLAPAQQAAVQHFTQQVAQQTAWAQHTQAPAVPAVAASQATHSVLVQAVQLHCTPDAVHLHWADAAQPPQQRYAMVLSAAQLRQWLVMLQRQFAQAQWPTAHWPQWLQPSTGAEDAALASLPAPAVWH